MDKRDRNAGAMNQTVAFIGAGRMGTPMVRRLLQAGFEVRIWNRSSARAVPLRDNGAVLAATPALAVQGADIVCLCLTDATAVNAVLFDAHNIAELLHADTTIIDFSTIGPDATITLEQRLRAILPSARWIDAPVTGGVKGAEAGELIILCGGDADIVELVRPILQPLSQRICHMGPLGSGQATKLCNQLIVAVNVLAIAEALSVGREFGLDIETLPDVLQGGWADSVPLQIIGSRMAKNISEPSVAALNTFAKDLKIILDNVGKEPFLASSANALYSNAIASGLSDRDVTILLDFVGKSG